MDAMKRRAIAPQMQQSVARHHPESMDHPGYYPADRRAPSVFSSMPNDPLRKMDSTLSFATNRGNTFRQQIGVLRPRPPMSAPLPDTAATVSNAYRGKTPSTPRMNERP
jgi:hypothetical protein